MAGGRIKYIDGPGGSDPAWRVDIAVGPSRRVAWWVVSIAAAAIACVLFSALDRAMAAAAVVAVTVMGVAALRREALREGRGAVRGFEAGVDGSIRVRPARGAPVAGRLRPGCFVAPWLVIVRWRPEGARLSRTVLVPPDAVDADAFRRLRVLLRWG